MVKREKAKSTLLNALVIIIFLCAICNAVFNLGEYDFFERLALASSISFNNPIDTALKVSKQVMSIQNWGELNIQWYQYIPMFFNWIGSIFSSVFDGIIEIAKTILNGLRAILIMLGFNV